MTPMRCSVSTAAYRMMRALNRSTGSRSATSHPPQLYLDFLAPAWHPQRAFTSIPLRKSSSHSRRPVLQHPSPTPSHAKASTSAASQPKPKAAAAPPSPGTPARAIANPRTDDDGQPLTIAITRRAAQRLSAIATKDNTPALALRVTVESGGCHGFQYLMSLTQADEVDVEEDTIFEDAYLDDASSEYRAKVVMDGPSLDMLKGSTVDYTMELIGSQFKITGIPGATSSCGCGTSFDVAF